MAQQKHDVKALWQHSGLSHFEIYEFLHVLLMILAWASSAYKVRLACNKLLPEGCRLLSADTNRMVSLWRILKRYNGDGPISNDDMRQMLEMACPRNLGMYYAHQVFELWLVMDLSGQQVNQVLSHPQRYGWGYEHFSAHFQIADAVEKLRAGVKVSGDRTKIYVDFHLELPSLTRDKALFFARFPRGQQGYRRPMDFESEAIRLWYTLDAAPLLDLLDFSSTECIVIKDGFNEKLQAELVAIGLKKLVAIDSIPVPSEDEWVDF